MIKRRKYHSVSHLIAFGLCRLLPDKVQTYFFTISPQLYLTLLGIALEGAGDEIMVGYEAGWPISAQQNTRWS